MSTNLGKPLGRRTFLASSTASVGLLSMPTISRATDREITVGTFGGFFQESFDEFVFPDFTQATGIKVRSIALPSSPAWLVQIQNAVRAGKSPADVSMMAGVSITSGVRQNLFKTLDVSKMPNVSNVSEIFIERGEGDQVYAIGGLAWYLTLCTNTEAYPEAPTSWGALWDEKNKGQIGLGSAISDMFHLEITAATFFGGTDILNTRKGIEKVFDKLGEVIPNVRLWWRDEGQFQQALNSGEIPMGSYFHDVTLLAADEGFPVRSTFPNEGGIVQNGSWVVTATSEVVDESQVFIDYSCDPATQALITRNVGTAPIIDSSATDLTAAELDAVTSSIAPIAPRYDVYLDHREWINERWQTMIAS